MSCENKDKNNTKTQVSVVEKPVVKTKPAQKVKKPSTIQTPNFDLLSSDKKEENDDKKKKYKKSKFRLKLFSAVFAIIAFIGIGWVTSNFIQINSLNNSINSTKYKIDEIQLIIKESQLDGFKDVQNDKDTLVTSVIEMEPNQLIEPTQIAEQSNWFDGFCKWLQNLFR